MFKDENFKVFERNHNIHEITQKEILSFKEACHFLNYSSSSLYKLTAKSKIPCYSPTQRKLIFRRSELLEWLLKNRKYSAEEIVQQSMQLLIKNKRRSK